MMRALLFCLVLICVGLTAPIAVGQKIELSVDASRAGAKIDRNIFGQFAEHPGKGVYEGVRVGTGSIIPNTRGIRDDVVVAGSPNTVVPKPVSAKVQVCRRGSRALAL
jgi:alpha-N-arabinofuranosidase